MCADYWVGEKSGAPSPSGRPTLAGVPLFDTQDPGVFEICETVNDNWGYVPGDANFKSPLYLQQYLLETVGRGGNFLLNIGPKPDGSLDEGSVAALHGLGRFVRRHERAFFGARAELNPRVNPHGLTMKRGNHAYFFLIEQTRLLDALVPAGDPLAGSAGETEVTFAGVKAPVKSVRVFDGQALAFRQANTNLHVTVPRAALSWPMTVIDVETDGPARVDGVIRRAEDGSYRLSAEWAAVYTAKPGCPRVRLTADGSGCIGLWNHRDARAEWLLDVPEGGCYEVALEQGCPVEFAGSVYTVEFKRPCDNVARMGAQHLTDVPAVRAAMAEKAVTRVAGVVAGTDGWGDYRSIPLGAVELPAGRVAVTLVPHAIPGGALADIRAITLKPRKRSQ